MGEIELVRPLGLAGIRCAVVAPRGDPARYSRFTKAAVEWVDPRKHPEELLARLTRFASSQPQPPVLYYDTDGDLLFVSRFRDRLRSSFRFVVPKATLVEDLVDKARFQALAEELQLPVPRALHLSLAEGETSLPDMSLRFPVVVKQLTRLHETWRPITTAKALHVPTREALEEQWPRLVEAGADVLVQEAILGAESAIESYHVYVDESARFVTEFTGKKIRTFPPAYGYSTALETTDTPDVLELGRDITRKLDLRGVAKFDFKRSQDGSLHLLEINPRFSLWHHLAARAGVNVPALVYADLVGLPRPPVVRARAGVRWCSLLHDAGAAKAAGIPLRRWLPWALSCEAKAVFAWDDPLPALGNISSRLSEKLRLRAWMRRLQPHA